MLGCLNGKHTAPSSDVSAVGEMAVSGSALVQGFRVIGLNQIVEFINLMAAILISIVV